MCVNKVVGIVTVVVGVLLSTLFWHLGLSPYWTVLWITVAICGLSLAMVDEVLQ